jgi:hypothetical protein
MVRLVSAPLALLLLSLTLTWAAISAEAADPGSITIQPSVATVSVDGTVDVAVVLDPPAETVSVFIIEIAYDPTVVQFVDCVPWDFEPLPSPFAASGCAAKDTDGDTIYDTAVVFGAYVENHSGVAVGFSTPQTVGTITFEALGKKGEASPLILSVCNDCILGPNAQTLTPTSSNGSISIVGDRGPSRRFPPWCSASWTKGGARWPMPQPGAWQCPAGL